MPNPAVSAVANQDNSPLLDVIFVHGLGGDSRDTWASASDDIWWPELLAQRHPKCAVWTATYTAPFTAFARSPGLTIRDQAANLALQLRNSGIGSRPSVFIMHSLGGLIVKAMCVQGVLGNKDNLVVGNSIVGLVFCGTPHRGSGFANAVRALGGLTGRQIRELRANTDELAHAHRDFLAWYSTRPDIAVQTYYETIGVAYRYLFLPFGRARLVVTQSSADTGIPDSPMYPVEANHSDLVKPNRPADAICAGVDRFLMQIETTLRQATSSIAESASSTFAHNLPLPVKFVGREDDLRRILKTIANLHQPLLIVGMGGMGKSATTLEALQTLAMDDGHASRSRRYEAAIWISAKDRDLRLADALSTVANVLSLTALGTAPIAEQIDVVLETLSQRACIVVLDNVEEVNDPELLQFLRRISGQSVLILTSRELQPAFEPIVVRLLRLDVEDAIALLTSEFARHDGDVTASLSRKQCERLCNACGSVPLALKWIAAQIAAQGQTVETVQSKLCVGEGLLFDNLFQAAWHLLPQEGRSVLITLPIFSGGGTTEAIAAAGGVAETTVAMGVSQLAKLSLLDFSVKANQETRRYSLHPLTAQFALARVTSEADHKHRLLLADWLVRQANQVQDGKIEGSAFLVDLPNLMEVIRWLAGESKWDHLLRLAIAVREILPDCGRWNEGVEIGRLGVRAAEALEDRYHEGRLSVIPLGWIARYRGDLAESERWYQRAVESFTAVGDLDRAAWARLALANLLLRQGREPDARLIAEGVRDSGVGATPIRVDVVRGAALVHLSEMAVARGDFTTAKALAEQARGLSLATGYRNTTMSATYWLGMAILRDGDPASAEWILRESLRLNKKAGVKMGIALCNVGLTECLIACGRAPEALKHADDGKALLLELGMRKELADFILTIEPHLDSIRQGIAQADAR